MMKYLVAIGLAFNSMMAASIEPMDVKQVVKPIIKGFAQNLQSELMTAVKNGGPVAGIQVCNTKVTEIANEHNQSGWMVSRTSLKYRNPNNKPDQWEEAQLLGFEKDLAKGVDPKSMWAVYEDDKAIRVMKAIPAKALCLTCHGEQLSLEVSGKLKELYPYDLATGYKQGQIRGAFSLIKQK